MRPRSLEWLRDVDELCLDSSRRRRLQRAEKSIGAGLHASVLPWLQERGVSVLVGDAVNDVQPSGVRGVSRPVHTMTQVFLGLPLVDNAYLEDVAREAAARRRWEFMISWQITSIPGGTASPFNAIATF